MKSITKYFYLAMCLMGISSCQEKEITPPEGCPEYKSIIRLWPKHHEDKELREELIQAFKQYPGSCDEVWFATDYGFPPLENPFARNCHSLYFVVAHEFLATRVLLVRISAVNFVDIIL